MGITSGDFVGIVVSILATGMTIGFGIGIFVGYTIAGGW